MTKEIKAGQVYLSPRGSKFAVTANHNDTFFNVVYNDGKTGLKSINSINRCSKIKSFKTWNKAIASKEFKQ